MSTMAWNLKRVLWGTHQWTQPAQGCWPWVECNDGKFQCTGAFRTVPVHPMAAGDVLPDLH